MSCAAIRAVDRFAIETLGIPGIVLMENAARSVAEVVYELRPKPESSVLVFCGPGNNGGDGFVIARLLHLAGVAVTVVLADRPAAADAATNFTILERMRLPCIDARAEAGLSAARLAAGEAGVVVDALLGTGSRGSPRGVLADLVRVANSGPALHVAVDIPSGLDGDTGAAGEPCFRADVTVTFVAEKLGFSKPEARAFTGRVVVVGIGAPLPPAVGESGDRIQSRDA